MPMLIPCYWEETFLNDYRISAFAYNETEQRLFILLTLEDFYSVNTTSGCGMRISPRPLFIIRLPMTQETYKTVCEKARSVRMLTGRSLSCSLIELLEGMFGDSTDWINRKDTMGTREIIASGLYTS